MLSRVRHIKGQVQAIERALEEEYECEEVLTTRRILSRSIKRVDGGIDRTPLAVSHSC
jgi:DNA-binding FrmR family transcriptional regulator